MSAPTDPHAELLEATRRARQLGYRFELCRIEFRDGKKKMTTEPPKKWQTLPQVDDAYVQQRIRVGCNAYLIHCELSGVTLHDGDSPEEIARIQTLYPGRPADVITRKGRHWYARSYVPGAFGKNWHMAYGPGSFYTLPDGVLQMYRGTLPAVDTLPPTVTPLATNGHRPMGNWHADTPRTVPRSVWERECVRFVRELTARLRGWQASGWGSEAHAGLLAASTHAARLSPYHAEYAYRAAFAAAGLEPNEDDLVKLASALEQAVPDQVVEDAAMDPVERFFAGGAFEGETAEPDTPTVPAVGRRRFVFLDEFEAASIPPPDPLVAGLLFRSTKARLFGPSTVGKTWTVLDLAAHVQNGLPWQGRAVEQAEVLYVAGEGAPSFAPRMATWREHHGQKTGVRLYPEAVQISGDQWSAFVEDVADAGFGLVVLDTQAAMTVGLKEDSNDDAGLLQRRLDELKTATGGACVLLVHHTGWADEGRPRGASGMFGGMDTELRLGEGTRGGIVLHTEKQRYVEKARPIGLSLAKAAGGLVVTAPTGTADGFFGDDETVRARALVAKLHHYRASGGEFKLTVRSITSTLRTEMNERGDRRLFERVAHLMKAEAGQPVNLDGGDET